MENHTDQRKVVAIQAEEFCLLTDNRAGAAYASATKYEWSHDDEKRRAWLHVEEICEYFGKAECKTDSGRNPIAFIGDTLGANVAMKLYRYYLSQCDGIEKSPVLTLDEFARIIPGSTLTDEERVELYILTRALMERNLALRRV